MRAFRQVKRSALLSIVLVGLVLGQLPVDGQTRRSGVRRRPAPPPESAQPTRQQQSAVAGVDTGQQVQLIQSPKSRSMAGAFNSGKLPEPARLPPGGVDERAAALAKAVSAGDDSSTAALYAAILAAGYGVRDAEGSVLQTTERGQGMAFDAWEVAAMSKLYGEGYGVGLGHLAEAFTRTVPAFKDVPLAAVLLEGVRAGAKSGHPAVRFWARFVVELGRQSPVPFDLLGQVDPAKIRLDAVQVFFILSRLTGDLALLERPAGQARQIPSPGGEEHAALFRRAHFRDAGGDGRSGRLRFTGAGMGRPGGSPSLAQSPCGTTDVQGVVLDWGALASTNLHGQLLERMGHTGKEIPIANIVLAVLKFVLSYAMLKTEINIGKQPLTRTKTTRPGELVVLGARIWIDNKAQGLNCLRPFLNSIGLDFNLPNSGPLSDVSVAWEGVLGFDEESRGSISAAQDFIRNVGKAPAPGERIVFFDFLPGTERSRTKQRTGSAGLSLIFVVGAPQAKDLSREKLTEVNKAAGVMVRVQLKATPKDAVGALSTIGDYAGPVIALLTGDVAGGVVGLATETLYRMSWRGSDPFYFVVKDWEPCEGQWFGTMTSSTRVETSNTDYGETPEVVKKDESMYRFEASIKLEGAKATATIEAEESLSSDQKSGYGRIIRQRKANAQYSGEVRASVDVSPSGRYGVGFARPRMSGTVQTSGSCERPAPYKCQQPTPTSGPWEPGLYMPGISGVVDPNKPNEINETRTWKDGSLEHKVTVNLKRCM